MFRALTRIGSLLLLAGAAMMFLIAALERPAWLTPAVMAAPSLTQGAIPMPVQRALDVAQAPGIMITATVGVDPHSCATARSVTVTAGTPVIYCYNILNSGDITFTDHLITDESLGLRAVINQFELTPLGGRQPTFYFTALITALASIHSTAVWTATNQGGGLAVAQSTAQVIVPSIGVTHTVGLDPNDCAATKQVAVMPDTAVIHCYRVENTGEVTFALHTVEDSRLGLLAEGWPLVLAPGATVELTATAVATTTNTSTVTWTAVVTDQLYATAVDWAHVELPAITVSTTVGHDSGQCAETTAITVTVGELVTFCYLVFNQSDIDFSPLIVHDNLFGDKPIVLTDTLLANGKLGFTLTAPITQAIANTVTWLAQAAGDLSATSAAVAYVDPLARIDVEAFEDSNKNLEREEWEAGFAGITLTLKAEQGATQVGHTDEDGRLSFMALATDQYTLTISSDGLQGYQANPSMVQNLNIERGGWYSATFALVRPTDTVDLYLPLIQH